MLEIVEFAESVTAVLVVFSTLLFLGMSLRVWSLKTFQAQISVFMLVWAAAELPHIVATLGLLDVEAYETFGLQLHFASMFAFATFIVLRARYLFGEARWNRILDKSLYDGLIKVLEKTGARAMMFYLDFSLLKKNPHLFAAALRKMFGPGASVLEKRILEALYQHTGLPQDTNSNLDFVKQVLHMRARLEKV